jgi:hypothetical protein
MAALLVTLPVSAASINLGDGGGLLGGGGSTGDANVSVDTNLLNGSGDDADARINLGDGLLGSGSDPTTADVDLFGTGNQSTTANVTLGTGDDATNGDVLVDLFGSGAGSGGNTGTRVALGTGGTGSNAAALDLFGDGAGAGSDGSGIPGDGSSGNGGGGISGGARTVGTVQIAAATPTPDASKCFAPTPEQQAKLVARHDYTQSVAAWGQVSELKVIDVGLCNSAAASIVAETNIGQLQSYVSSHPEIRAGLDKLGRAPSEVIAGDKSGGTLTLYVM